MNTLNTMWVMSHNRTFTYVMKGRDKPYSKGSINWKVFYYMNHLSGPLLRWTLIYLERHS